MSDISSARLQLGTTSGELTHNWYLYSRATYTGYRKKNITPWDQAKPHAALVRTLEEAGNGQVPSIPTTGRALVPGCGRV